MSNENNKELKALDCQQISFWLNDQRRKGLKEIAAGLPGNASASDAIARAIELARAYQSSRSQDSIERLDALDSTLEIKLDAVRGCIDLQSQKIERLEHGLRSIHELISAVAESSDPASGVLSDSGVDTPIDFKTWLESAVAMSGRRPERSAIAVAAWRRSSWVAETLVSLDFMVHVATIDSKAVANGAGEARLARLGLVDATNPLAKIHANQTIFFVCQPLGNGWVLHAHAANNDGGAGELIAKIQI